jgi:hypothetical protein
MKNPLNEKSATRTRQQDLGRDQAAPPNKKKCQLSTRHYREKPQHTSKLTSMTTDVQRTLQTEQPLNQAMLLEPTTFDNIKYKSKHQ